MATLAVLVPTIQGAGSIPLDQWAGATFRATSTVQRLLSSGSYDRISSWIFASVKAVNTKRVSGFFRDETGAGIARAGLVVNRSNGALMATFTSSAGTGAFTALVPDASPAMVVLVPGVGDGRNAVVLDNIVPVS